ncbi:MAG: PepSY-like domain-containing protein [Ferruginibacter sp.]
MKKLMMISALATIVTMSACAQKLDASKVPAAVKAAFKKQYPGVTAKWEKEDGDYEAGFKQNGNEMSTVFDAAGTMKESEMEIKASELSANIQAYVAQHYKGKTIKDAAKITMANGTVNYEANVNGKDVIFDANGNFLKEAKD